MQSTRNIIKTNKPKYPIRTKPTVLHCTMWDRECPADAQIFLSRLGVKYYG